MLLVGQKQVEIGLSENIDWVKKTDSHTHTHTHTHIYIYILLLLLNTTNKVTQDERKRYKPHEAAPAHFERR